MSVYPFAALVITSDEGTQLTVQLLPFAIRTIFKPQCTLSSRSDCFAPNCALLEIENFNY